MGWVNKLFGGSTPAESAQAPAEEAKAVDFSPELWAALNGGWGLPTKSGNTVSGSSSLMVTAFYRAIMVIADGFAQLPVEIYRTKEDGGVEPARDHPLYDMLLHRPSGLQDATGFWRTMLMHAAGRGHGVAYRNVVNGEIRELIPVRPECVQIDLHPILYEPIYDITFEKGGFARCSADEIFIIRGPSWAPHKSLDPTVIGREAIGLAQATEESHSRLHANSARPSGVLETDHTMQADQVEVLREMWRQAHTGTANVGSTPILTGGLKWQQTGMSGVDAEHLDTRKHQIEEIARLVGVFPIMLGHAGDQSPTFASADAFLEAHVRYTLQPWFKTVKAAIETQLLTREERRAGFHVRIDSSELLRGSLKDRTEYYKAALGTNSSPGWLAPNEIREDDGWNRSDDPEMDKVWQPATMAPVNAQPGAPGGARPARPQDEAKTSTPRTLYVSRRLLNGEAFLRWARAQGFKVTLPADELHVTIAYSRSPIDWMTIGEPWGAELTLPAGGPRVVEAIGPKGAVALKFVSSELTWRHEAIRERGASWAWPEYQPHVTITYDAAGVDLAAVEPYQGELRFGPEIFAEVEE